MLRAMAPADQPFLREMGAIADSVVKRVVAEGRKYIGRYSWKRRGPYAEVGYCFVNGKGRDYLTNYRKVREAAISEFKAAGVMAMLLPFKKESLYKLKFVKYLMRPVVAYAETDTHIYFCKAVGG